MAGSEIDTLFGAKLGLSTLAAAGLGNMVSDVAGVSMANRIEVKLPGLQSEPETLQPWIEASTDCRFHFGHYQLLRTTSEDAVHAIGI